MFRNSNRCLKVFFLLLFGIFMFISSAVATEYTYIGPNNGELGR